MKFELPTELSSIIKVVGVGGGGSNAVNHMHAQGIRGVDFIICNTDKQALDMSKIPVKLQIGPALTEGLGAGAVPERGKDAAQENIEEIRQLLSTRTKMLFITAGMGGGTGTGAAPVIARVARDMGILTVGIVTMPFVWEGRRRKLQAATGVEELRQAVDTLLVINNDRLRDLYGNLSMDDAFAHADDILSTAARGIAEIITTTGKVNVDFEDVRTVMTNSGVAIMGMAEAEGEDRAIRAATDALASPLLNDNDISGAKYVLLNIALGTTSISMDEMSEVTEYIQTAAGSTADVIWGYCTDENLGDRIRVTVIATGFVQNELSATLEPKKDERKVIPLDAALPTMITAPITSPVSSPVGTSKAPPVLKEEVTSNEPYMKPAVPEVPVESEQARIVFEEPVARVAPPVVERPQPQPVPQPKAEDKVIFELYDTTAKEPVNEAPVKEQKSEDTYRGEVHRATPAEHQARVDDRLSRMREMSMRLRTPNGVADMEREPAYKRKNVVLADGPHSTDSNVSRYTLSEGTDETGERRMELKRNNPFLHDNVD